MKSKSIIAKPIIIEGNIKRHQIVRKVVNAFIKTEYNKKGKGVVFNYPVENMGTEKAIYIARPGHKKNFDFKVIVTKKHMIGEGSHAEIVKGVRRLRFWNRKKFDLFWESLGKIYRCEESDVDKILKRRHKYLPTKYIDLLKIIKWMFIMEDIIYWDNEGRAFLYNALLYNVSLGRKAKSEDFTQPERLKSRMRRIGLSWEMPE